MNKFYLKLFFSSCFILLSCGNKSKSSALEGSGGSFVSSRACTKDSKNNCVNLSEKNTKDFQDPILATPGGALEAQDKALADQLQKKKEFDDKNLAAESLSGQNNMSTPEHFYKCNSRLTYAAFYYKDKRLYLTDPLHITDDSSHIHIFHQNKYGVDTFKNPPYSVVRAHDALYVFFRSLEKPTSSASVDAQEKYDQVFYSSQSKPYGPWHTPKPLDVSEQHNAIPTAKLLDNGDIEVSLYKPSYTSNSSEIIVYKKAASGSQFIRQPSSGTLSLSSTNPQTKTFEKMQSDNNMSLAGLYITMHSIDKADTSRSFFSTLIGESIGTLTTFGAKWPLMLLEEKNIADRKEMLEWSETSQLHGEAEVIRNNILEQHHKIQGVICP